MNWSMFFDATKAHSKRVDSLLKSTWDFKNYPIKVWKAFNVRDKKFVWQAEIIYWHIMHRTGSTKKEALNNLRESFQSYKANNKDLPRPGMLVKTNIVFPPIEEIVKYSEIQNDFTEKILSVHKIHPLLFTKFSSLANYEPQDEHAAEAQRTEIIKNVFTVYSIDIREYYDGPLFNIFEMIQNKSPQN